MTFYLLVDSLPKPGILPPPPEKEKTDQSAPHEVHRCCESHKPRNINIWYPDWNQNMLRYRPQLQYGRSTSFMQFPPSVLFTISQQLPWRQNSVFRSGGWSFTKTKLWPWGQITISMPHFPATTLYSQPPKKNLQNHLRAPITAKSTNDVPS